MYLSVAKMDTSIKIHGCIIEIFKQYRDNDFDFNFYQNIFYIIFHSIEFYEYKNG